MTDHQYTKDQCINWIKNPTTDPITNEPFPEDPITFKRILDNCRMFLNS
jgi:hypothetical protein